MSILIFSLITFAVFFVGFKQFRRIWRNIGLGKAETISGDVGLRWKNVFLVAFGQQKMFKEWKIAVLHGFIYIAFLFTQIEFIEILVDGFTGNHRFFALYLGGIYPLLINSIEILSILAFMATLIFLARRNVFLVSRFQKPELDGFPRKDANRILFAEILLIIGIFSMNSADGLLQNLQPQHYPETGHLYISSIIGNAFFSGLSENSLIVIERFGWWLHLFVVYGFLLYLPFSKHLHIFLAFPNVYFQPLKPRGEMENMPEIMNEVKSMMGLSEETSEAPPLSDELPTFGAKEVTDLSWKTLLEAYSCTECGRCTEQCPANLTGKKLSPRKIMMDIRDRTEELGARLDKNESLEDGKSLFDYISPEELNACTTCNACVEACPIAINPLTPILALRRYEILTNSAGPAEWLPMFNSLENSGAVWQMPVSRDEWRTDASL